MLIPTLPVGEVESMGKRADPTFYRIFVREDLKFTEYAAKEISPQNEWNMQSSG